MPPVLKKYDPPKDELSVIFSDDHLLVIDKPSGLLSVPGKSPDHADCVISRAQAICPDALLVHRLDMETSGIFIMAKTKQAQRHLGLQFENRNTQKTYVARVWGHIGDNQGQVDLPLICDWPNRPKQMVDKQNGKQAITDWTVLERSDADAAECYTTRVELRPKTGRSHQLRVHMLALGHPILGDQLYAEGKALMAADRLQLHAQSLTVMHPTEKNFITFEARCPF